MKDLNFFVFEIISLSGFDSNLNHIVLSDECDGKSYNEDEIELAVFGGLVKVNRIGMSICYQFI